MQQAMNSDWPEHMLFIILNTINIICGENCES